MNVSEKHQIIWLAPEGCATQITKKILENYDFKFSVRNDNDQNPNAIDSYYFHTNEIDDSFSDYRILLSLRNPYDFVFSFYLKKFVSTPLTRDSVNVKEKFNHWVKKMFLNHDFHVFITPLYNEPSFHFNKWTFNNEIIPDFVIKTENLFEDLLKLPFIQNESDEMRTKIKSLIDDNSFINRRYHKFDELYDFTSAKLVYNFFKPIFFKFDYNPFSFTKETITNEEKIRFIHGSIDN